MPKRPSNYPTQAELEILNILWRVGPRTVREIHQALQADRKTALTTTLRIIQYMEAKNLVARDGGRPARYQPRMTQAKTQAGMLSDLLKRAFEGSLHTLLVRAVEDVELSGEEYGELRELILRHKGDKHEPPPTH